jgi:DNA-damage-inducible protein J
MCCTLDLRIDRYCFCSSFTLQSLYIGRGVVIMAKTSTVQARIEPQLKQKADAILQALGINATTAITLFYTQMVRQSGMPIELKVLNDDVVAAMQELKDPSYRESAPKFKSVKSLMADLNS